MKVGLVTIAYYEPRFITPFLEQLPDWIDEKLVLVSSKPWQGKPETTYDSTETQAMLSGAHVLVHDWATEQDQRNAGQAWFWEMDWIITLDPDEALTKDGWASLKEFLNDNLTNSSTRAYVCRGQLTYWKSGYVIDPPEDYKQIIAIRPTVKFVDKRVVNCPYGAAPVLLHHFSWARTDDEVLRKLRHYSHAHEIDTDAWYRRVWLPWQPKMENLHPLTPKALKHAIPVKVPDELKGFTLG